MGVANHARLARVTPHRLRHTFSRRFLDDSGDLVMLNRLLGHRRLETTAIYTNLDSLASNDEL